MRTAALLCVLIGIIAVLTFSPSPPQGAEAFGFIPRILVAQIAAFHNSTTQPTLQPILTNAFDGYYQPYQYTLPQAAGELPQALEKNYSVFQQLTYNPYPFNVAKDTRAIRSVPVGQTNAPFLTAQTAYNMLNRTAVVWSKAQNIAALLNLIPALHNPLRCINLFSEAHPHGDESGRHFAIDFTAQHPPHKYTNLADAVDDVFGFTSPTNLPYSLTSLNKTTTAATVEEARRIMHLFPADSFDPKSITIPPAFTRTAVLILMKEWAHDSNLIAMNIYNTIFSAAKAQPKDELMSARPVSDWDRANTLDVSLFDPEVLPVISPDEQLYFRYMLLKQLALAGYRLSSLLSRLSVEVHEEDLDSHPGNVSNLYRALTIATVCVTLFIFYWIYVVMAAKAKLQKQREEEQDANTQDQNHYNTV